MLDRTNEPTTAAEIILEAGKLNDALRRVRHAICNEETRYYLNGVYVHYVARDNAVRFVATDGHRLAAADEGNAISGQLIDGTFPDYARVVPCGEPQYGSAIIAREPFLRAVSAVTEFGTVRNGLRYGRGKNGCALRFAFAGDRVTISTAFEDTTADCGGSASATVKQESTSIVKPREVGFCGPFIVDILHSLQGQHIRFDFFDIGGPNSFCGDSADGSAMHVIMPVRL
jgi:DNA polymerase-3 subunit beta